MRALVVLIAGLLCVSSAQALELRVGGDAGLFFRGEAGGNRTVLPTLAPRLTLDLPLELGAEVLWPVAYAPGGDGLGAVSTLHHRLVLRATASLRFKTTSFYAGGGAAVVFSHSWLWDGELARAKTTTVRSGPALALGVDVDVGKTRLRCGLEGVIASGRRDVSVVVGASLPVWGTR